MIPGHTVNLGGEDYVLAPLTMSQLRDGCAKDIVAVQDAISQRDMLSESYREAMVRIVRASLSRNYPEISEKRVGDILDMGNSSKAFMAVIGLSIPKRTGEDSGETGAEDV